MAKPFKHLFEQMGPEARRDVIDRVRETLDARDAVRDALTALVAPDGLVPSEETVGAFLQHLASLGFTLVRRPPQALPDADRDDS